MIPKILPASQSYSGIGYSEKKVDKNLGDFVEAYNFGYLELETVENKTAEAYEKYLNRWSEKNRNVKNKQLHVSISCKGREYSKDELVQIGKKWLSEMGNDGLPTMIYFHRDTPNNHIHIITTRIGIDGKKINDSNERYRSRTAINKIMKVDLKANCKNDFANALEYTFSGTKQFEMILNAKGYSTAVADDRIECYKEGNLLLSRPIELVQWAENRNKVSGSNEAHKKRNKQIYSIFKKYRKTGNLQDFQKLMKSRFNLSIVFFGKKDAPYGYAIVDERDKRVIKGSDVYKLKDLLQTEQDRVQKLKDAITNLIDTDDKISRKAIYAELRKWGALLIKNDVVDKESKEVIFSLDDKQAEKLNYNYRLTQANNFNIKNDKERELLAELFSVKIEDVLINKDFTEDDKNYYRDVLIASENDNGLLRDANIFVVKKDDAMYVVDKENARIYSFDELNYQYSYEKGIDIINSRNGQWASQRDGIDDILDLMLDNSDDLDVPGGADNSLKKKRKRK